MRSSLLLYLRLSTMYNFLANVQVRVLLCTFVRFCVPAAVHLSVQLPGQRKSMRFCVQTRVICGPLAMSWLWPTGG